MDRPYLGPRDEPRECECGEALRDGEYRCGWCRADIEHKEGE